MEIDNYVNQCHQKMTFNEHEVEKRKVFWDIALKVAHIQKNSCPNIENSVHLILNSNHIYPENMRLVKEEGNIKNKETNQLLYYLNPKIKVVDYMVETGNEKKKDTSENSTENTAEHTTENTLAKEASSKKSLTYSAYDFLLNQGKSLAIRETSINNCLSFGCYEKDNIWLCKIVSIITNKKLKDCLSIDKIKLIEDIERIHKEIDPLTIKDTLCSYGNETLIIMIGAILEAIKHRTVILIDNYPAAVALLVAQQMDEKALENCIFTNLSPYKCHQVVIDYFEKKSILKLDYTSNIGEGIFIAKTVLDGALQWFSNLKPTL